MYLFLYICTYIYIEYCELVTLAADENPTKLENGVTLSEGLLLTLSNKRKHQGVPRQMNP